MRPSRLRSAWRGLTPQLFLFAVLPLTGLLLVIAFGSLSLHSQAMRALVGQREARAAHAAAEAVGQHLESRAEAVRAMAVLAGEAASPQAALDGFAFLHQDFDGGLAILDADARVLASTGESGHWRDRPLAEVASAATDGEPVFSLPFTDPATGETLVLVASRGPSGVLAVGAVSPRALSAPVLSEALDETADLGAWVVDADGRVLFAAGPSTEDADPPALRAVRTRASGVAFHTDADHEVVVAYHPVEPIGWTLVLAEPWESVDSPLLRQTQAAPLVLIPALVFAVLAVAFGLRQIVQPLQALERRAADLGRSRFESIEEPVGGIDEIKSLQATLVEMARQLRASRDAIRGYVGALTRAQEEERRRLARELHDQTVQSLIALDQRAQIALRAVGHGETDAVERLAEVRGLTTSLLEELRRVIRGLRPIYLEDLGLLAALEILSRETEAATGAAVHFETRGDPQRLSPEREIAVFRIAQEALSNIGRHAGAEHIELRVEFANGRFVLEIRDDGRGFTPPALSDLAAAGHFGLLGMHERAQLIGAALDIRSNPGAGTTIVLTAPV